MTDHEGLDELLRRVDMQNARRAAGQSESIRYSSSEEYDAPECHGSGDTGTHNGRIERALKAIKALGRSTHD